MIVRQQLEQKLQTRDRKIAFETLAQTLFDEGFPLSELIDLTFQSNSEAAFRAAWLLELTFVIGPLHYINDIPYIVKRLPEITNDSCRRHFVKILLNIIKSRTLTPIANKLKELDLEPVVETLFDWLIDPKVKIAVKVFSADALLQLSNRYPWIKDELQEQVQFLMRGGSAAIQSRGKKILQQLQKEKHLQKD